VNEFLVDDYVLEAGGRYLGSLGDREPTTVKIVPTVPTESVTRFWRTSRTWNRVTSLP